MHGGGGGGGNLRGALHGILRYFLELLENRKSRFTHVVTGCVVLD